jgi:hypothetical protein
MAWFRMPGSISVVEWRVWWGKCKLHKLRALEGSHYENEVGREQTSLSILECSAGGLSGLSGNP